MTKVINFFGAPGSGKTTTALGLSYFAKLEGFSVEYVSEVARELAYHGNLKEARQYDIMMAQYNKVSCLIDKVDFIITDSPVLLSYVYTHDVTIQRMAIDRHNQFDNINFLLSRTHRYYNDTGRIHNEQQSDFIADRINDCLRNEKIPSIPIQSEEVQDAWFYYILSRMREQTI